MDNIKIFVTYKNRHKVIETDIIKPIQTGRAIADEVFENMLGDDTGDNISKENPYYNELSAQYWVWKNYEKIGNPDYIGFMHYRRHFLFDEISSENREPWLPNSNFYCFNRIDNEYLKYLDTNKIIHTIEGYDCILPFAYDMKNHPSKSILNDYKNFLLEQKIQHLYLMFDIVKEKFPDYKEAIDIFLEKNFKYICNMFIMRKELFYKYNEFLFPVLKEVKNRVDDLHYSTQESRYLGYLGEILLNIFIIKNSKQIRIKEVNTSFIQNTSDNDIVYPYFNANSYCIAMSSSNEYVPYLSVCLQSIKEHASDDKNYDLIVFSKEITERNKQQLKVQIEQSNIKLRFVNPSYLFENKNLYIACKYFKEECYYRIAAPIVIKGYDKILFTDIDLVYNKDAAEIFNCTENMIEPLAAVKDPIMAAYVNSNINNTRVYIENTLNIGKSYLYVNTGVLVFNTKQYIEQDLFEKILNICLEKQFLFQEQDAINSILGEKIFHLPLKCNYTPMNSMWANDNVEYYMPLNILNEYKNAEKNAIIVHYAGGITKPWEHPEEKQSFLWWEYARRTPYYEEILYHQMRSQTIDTSCISDAINWNKLCLQYIKYKFLGKILFGKTRQRYKQKRYIYKERINNAKKYRTNV